MKPPADAAAEAGVSVPPPRTAPDGLVAGPAERTDAGRTGPAERTGPAGSADLILDQEEADQEATAAAAPGAGQSAGTRDDGLTERERGILAFEQRWWRHAGAKEQAIRDTFGLSATRYYQLLNALLDNPAALAAEPLLIGRLRRLRASQARSRRR